MGDRSRTLVSAALFLALGLAGAFVVSAVAGFGDEEPAPTGLRALDRGVDRAVDDRSAVRVEVLNGSGAAGSARDATHHLRNAGFDVVFFGNAERFDHARSVVIDRVGNQERAEGVAGALGIDSVATSRDSSLMLEVTVVLGEDWPPAPAPELDWSDRIRELLGREVGPDGATDSVPAPSPRS